MRIAIHSSSAAVRRTMAALLETTGHTLATTPDDAALVVIDTLNPTASAAPTLPALRFVASASGSDDDTIVCPARPQMLMQRVLSLTQTHRFALGNGWSLRMLARQLTHTQSAPLALTEKECDLLKHLLQAHPASVRREALLEQVWGMVHEMDTHTLETHIYRLRAKLESLKPPPGDIITDSGAYRFVTKD